MDGHHRREHAEFAEAGDVRGAGVLDVLHAWARIAGDAGLVGVESDPDCAVANGVGVDLPTLGSATGNRFRVAVLPKAEVAARVRAV